MKVKFSLFNEGITIPKTYQIEVLIPFMERNGYIYYGGWWYKPEDLEYLMKQEVRVAMGQIYLSLSDDNNQAGQLEICLYDIGKFG